MSGIAGLYRFNGSETLAVDVERMATALAHRGPDGSGVWNHGPVGLGHRMLWTTPESLAERLPIVDQRGNLVVTADARIDNRDELIGALGLGGCSSREITDGELILAAYERWGDRCPERLLGDFAFAIWDRPRRTLFCARDHFGVKPFYYHRSPRLFAFASEIKALLRLPEVPRRLNEVRVGDYLAPILEDKIITFYEEILRLPPAHTMTVTPEGSVVRPYWALDPARELKLGSDGEYDEAFRALFTEAVRCRLRSAFPVGSMLSGGLDSSSIVCVARRLLGENGGSTLHTFSAVFPEVPECDERRFIDTVLAQTGLEPHYVRGDRLSPLLDSEGGLGHEDEAIFAPNWFLHSALYRAARESGVRVLFDGFDGDTTLWHSLAYLGELVRAMRWKTLITEAKGLSERFDRPAWRFLWTGVSPLVPEPVRHGWRRIRRRSLRGWEINPTISPGLARRVRLEERVSTFLGSRVRPPRTSREEHWRRLTWGVLPCALEWADQAAAALSIDPRYPFFDRRLVEFCLALPAEQKLHRGWTRMIARRAMAGVVPAEVRWRGKANLSPVLPRGLTLFDLARIEAVIEEPKEIAEYVSQPALRDAFQRYTCKSLNDPALAVWRATMLALWLRQSHLAL